MFGASFAVGSFYHHYMALLELKGLWRYHFSHVVLLSGFGTALGDSGDDNSLVQYLVQIFNSDYDSTS